MYICPTKSSDYDRIMIIIMHQLLVSKNLFCSMIHNKLYALSIYLYTVAWWCHYDMCFLGMRVSHTYPWEKCFPKHISLKQELITMLHILFLYLAKQYID